MKNVAEIREVREFQRIGAHSHIKGLGLDENLKAKFMADGFVGQTEAREAAGVIVKMVKEGKMAGRAILFAGPPGTGKTALAYGVSRELGADVPFVLLTGSEVYSSELKKTEVLMRAIRKAIGIRIKEIRKIYEGEIVNLKVNLVRHPYNPYQQIPESATLTLKTTQEEKTFNVGQQVAINLIQQGISEGDIINIDAETGRVTKLGKSSKAAKKYEIEGEKILDRPSGPILKEKEFIYTMTLHDLDEMNARRGGSLLSAFFGIREEKEIDMEVRAQVDETVKAWINEGRAQMIPGVLFIDECSLLDIEALSFLNDAMESELAPIIILSTNRGITEIRGTNIKSPLGLPLDLLDRILIVKTRPYTQKEIEKIIEIRCKEEKISLEEEAKKLLVQIGMEKSLRYAVMLLTPSAILAKTNNRSRASREDVKKAMKLFSDIQSTVKFLKEYEEKMLKT